ncbi:unnamed protein product [Prunus armeniaca]
MPNSRAEVWGLFFGLKLALEKGLSDLAIEMDSSLVVKLCLKPSLLGLHPMASLIDSCCDLMKQLEVRLEATAVGQEFFYKLINDSLWMTSSHLDMGMFLIRKRQFAHPLAVGTDWMTADCCLQTFLEPVKLPLKKRGSKKQDV